MQPGRPARILVAIADKGAILRRVHSWFRWCRLTMLGPHSNKESPGVPFCTGLAGSMVPIQRIALLDNHPT